MHIHQHNLPLPGQEDEKYIQPMADTFKVLSDPTRIRILALLAHQEMCVTCIAEALEMTHSAISHQLRILRSTNLVKFTKDGKEVIYSLDDSHVLSLFDQALDHVKHKMGQALVCINPFLDNFIFSFIIIWNSRHSIKFFAFIIIFTGCTLIPIFIRHILRPPLSSSQA